MRDRGVMCAIQLFFNFFSKVSCNILNLCFCIFFSLMVPLSLHFISLPVSIAISRLLFVTPCTLISKINTWIYLDFPNIFTSRMDFPFLTVIEFNHRFSIQFFSLLCSVLPGPWLIVLKAWDRTLRNNSTGKWCLIFLHRTNLISVVSPEF